VRDEVMELLKHCSTSPKPFGGICKDSLFTHGTDRPLNLPGDQIGKPNKVNNLR